MTVIIVIIFFTSKLINNIFLKLHEDHPYLHSFPTRRSSDLEIDDVRGNDRPPFSRRIRELGRVVQLGVRSEEHTSELQSLRHLVCRLLLEKKKQNRQMTKD